MEKNVSSKVSNLTGVVWEKFTLLGPNSNDVNIRIADWVLNCSSMKIRKGHHMCHNETMFANRISIFTNYLTNCLIKNDWAKRCLIPRDDLIWNISVHSCKCYHGAMGCQNESGSLLVIKYACYISTGNLFAMTLSTCAAQQHVEWEKSCFIRCQITQILLSLNTLTKRQ